MIKFNDIYFKVDSRIVEQGFWQVDITQKKFLIDKELKEYAIEKLRLVNKEHYMLCSSNSNINVGDIVGMLASDINKEEHMNTLSHFIHYILQFSGSLQGHSIVWWVEETEELIKEPLIEFNESGCWENLMTHRETDYAQVFNFVYEVFNKHFLVDSVQRRAKLKSSNTNYGV